MTEYDYRTVDLSNGGLFSGVQKPADPEDELNELGKEGFRVVERIDHPNGGTEALVLMREVSATDD